eukprot:9498333-Alexandrium_andersonii.AAC.1
MIPYAGPHADPYTDPFRGLRLRSGHFIICVLFDAHLASSIGIPVTPEGSRGVQRAPDGLGEQKRGSERL